MLVAASAAASHASAATIQSGDVLVAGSGLTWLRSNGVAVGQLNVGGARVAAVAAEHAGLDSVYASVGFDIRHYDATGAYSYTFRPDELSERVTAVDASTASNRIAVAVSQTPGIHHIFVFSLETVNRHVWTEKYVLVDAEVRDLDLASDGCTVAYATTLGVRRLNVCTGVQLPHLTDTAARAVRLLPDGAALVVVGGAIRQLDARGAALRTFRVNGVEAWSSVDLTPDGGAIWAATPSGRLYRIDRTSGLVAGGPITVTAPVDAIAVFGAPEGAAPPVPGLAGSDDLQLDGLPTLTSQRLSGAIAVSAAPGTDCRDDVPFEVSPISMLGPYVGTFAARGSFVVGTTAVAATVPSPLTRALGARSISGAFTISSPRANVAGAYRSSKGTSSVAGCEIYTNYPGFRADDLLTGYYWYLRASGLPYEARIARGGKTYFDRGASTLLAARYFLRGSSGTSYGTGGRFAQQFRSDLLGVTEAFGRVGQSARHRVKVPKNTRTITLSTRWASRDDAFSLVGAQVVRGGRVLASTGAGGARLTIGVSRTPTSITLTVKDPPAGELVFRVAPTRLKKKKSRTTTSATTTVRRRAHRP